MNLKSHDGAPLEITEAFHKATASKTNQPKSKSAPPFSLRLTRNERAWLNEQAGNQPLGAYIRSHLFGKEAKQRRRIRRPGPDHKKLALILAELGRSRLSSNMNQLARAANMGTLDASESEIRELQEACRAIARMRDLLITALGLKPEGNQ